MKAAIADQWHQIMGYVSLKVIFYFEVSVEGVKIQ